jgi:hypothetical protein
MLRPIGLSSAHKTLTFRLGGPSASPLSVVGAAEGVVTSAAATAGEFASASFAISTTSSSAAPSALMAVLVTGGRRDVREEVRLRREGGSRVGADGGGKRAARAAETASLKSMPLGVVEGEGRGRGVSSECGGEAKVGGTEVVVEEEPERRTASSSSEITRRLMRGR